MPCSSISAASQVACPTGLKKRTTGTGSGSRIPWASATYRAASLARRASRISGVTRIMPQSSHPQPLDHSYRDGRHWPRQPLRAERQADSPRSEEHTSELQSLMRISYAVFCLKKKNNHKLEKTK